MDSIVVIVIVAVVAVVAVVIVISIVTPEDVSVVERRRGAVGKFNGDAVDEAIGRRRRRQR